PPRDPSRPRRQDLPHPSGRCCRGARRDVPDRGGERVHRPGRTERLRQEHASQAGGWPRARHGRDDSRARASGERALSRRGLRLPATRAPALAQRARQRALLGGDARPRSTRAPEAGGRSPRAHRARGLRDEVSARAVRRHAAARGHLPCPAPRPGPALDGRALRRSRRHDPRGDGPRAPPHLGGAAQDHSLRHPQHPGGDSARRPGRGHVAAARTHRTCDRREPGAPAHRGPGVRHALQGAQRRGAQPDLLRAEGARVSTARRLLGETFVPLATLVGALVVWEAATRALRIPRFIMPAPSAILGEGWEWRYRFIHHTWVTLYETLGGFALSMAVGVPLAVLIVYSPLLRGTLYPLIVLAQSVPKIAI